MKKYIYYIIGVVAIFLAGLFVGGKSVPPKIIEKKVEVVKVEKDVKTVIKRVKTPDGTVTTEIVKEDKSKESSSKSSETITNNEKQWKATVFADVTRTNYGGLIERRIIGPVFVGAGAVKTPESTIGVVSVSIEF